MNEAHISQSLPNVGLYLIYYITSIIFNNDSNLLPDCSSSFIPVPHSAEVVI